MSQKTNRPARARRSRRRGKGEKARQELTARRATGGARKTPCGARQNREPGRLPGACEERAQLPGISRICGWWKRRLRAGRSKERHERNDHPAGLARASADRIRLIAIRANIPSPDRRRSCENGSASAALQLCGPAAVVDVGGGNVSQQSRRPRQTDERTCFSIFDVPVWLEPISEPV